MMSKNVEKYRVKTEVRITKVFQNDPQYTVVSAVAVTKQGWLKTARDLLVIKITGERLPLEPVVGQQWLLEAIVYLQVKQHGRDMRLNEWHTSEITNFELTMPHTRACFVQFLSQDKEFEGIGPKKAGLLWNSFGHKIFHMVRNDTTEALQSILSNKSIAALKRGFQKYENLEHINWLASKGVPMSVNKRLFRYHKKDSIEAIKSNPYKLLSFGMPFKKVDKLAQEEFKISESDSRRYVAAIQEALIKHGKRGHTCADKGKLITGIKDLLGVNHAQQALSTGSSEKAYIQENDRYYLTGQYVMEKVIAKRLAKLLHSRRNWSHEWDVAFNNACEELTYPLNSEQAHAIITSLENHVSVVTGGAGCGKTTVTRTILKAYHALGYQIHAVALSGRAAMRLHESIGFDTMTIAKFLKEKRHDKPESVLVIDEASMLDVASMYKLITNIPPTTRIVLVGDKNQLPPIGAGLIFSDIVNSGVIPTAVLKETFRSGKETGIPDYSKTICAGEVPQNLSEKNVHFHDVPVSDIKQTVIDLYMKLDDAQVVGATYESHLAGIKIINSGCQKAVNPDGERLEFDFMGERKFLNIRVGDPVIFTKNNYDIGVQNGTLGTLADVEETDIGYGVIEVCTGGKPHHVHITQTVLDNIQLAYAISLHKAQGSQFKRVIVVLSGSRLEDRSWIYTAITRAEHELHIVGTKDLFIKAIKRDSAEYTRTTNLQYFLDAEVKNKAQAAA